MVSEERPTRPGRMGGVGGSSRLHRLFRGCFRPGPFRVSAHGGSPNGSDHRRVLRHRRGAGSRVRAAGHHAASVRTRCRPAGRGRGGLRGARRHGAAEMPGCARRGGDGRVDRGCGQARSGDRQCRHLGRRERGLAGRPRAGAGDHDDEYRRCAEHRPAGAAGHGGTGARLGWLARADRRGGLDRRLRAGAARGRLLRVQGGGRASAPATSAPR
jgi:hypothetical protein